MNRCLLTYQHCGDQRYSKEGLRSLSSKLQSLQVFPLRKEEQLKLALEYADKLSFSGVQKKLNARLAISKATFEVVPRSGTYIIKPQNPDYSELPENEDLTMKLADCVGIDTPLHGLLHCSDGSLSYFIKRFDRTGKGRKIAVEDFSQLAGLSRDTKYDFSMERLIPLIDRFCTFPAVEKKKLFQRTLFSFLIGNEDLHLKNFSLIHHGQTVEFSPAYDLVNSTIVTDTGEEMALPLRGKKSNFTRGDLVDYYGHERLNLAPEIINDVLVLFQKTLRTWAELISISFLSEEKKKAYLNLLDERKKRIFAPHK